MNKKQPSYSPPRPRPGLMTRRDMLRKGGATLTGMLAIGAVPSMTRKLHAADGSLHSDGVQYGGLIHNGNSSMSQWVQTANGDRCTTQFTGTNLPSGVTQVEVELDVENACTNPTGCVATLTVLTKNKITVTVMMANGKTYRGTWEEWLYRTYECVKGNAMIIARSTAVKSTSNKLVEVGGTAELVDWSVHYFPPTSNEGGGAGAFQQNGTASVLLPYPSDPLTVSNARVPTVSCC